MDEININLDIAREQMTDSIAHLDDTLAKIRAGKASPQMLRNVTVNYYGASTPLNQTANISTPDAQTITIQPFDKNIIKDIEIAIVESNLGFNPSNNGEKIIINVPPLTEERRRELVKQVKVEIENSKVTIRSIRQKTNDEMKRLGKEGLSEDLLRDAEEKVQKLTDEFSTKINEIFTQKESEIMKV